MRPLLQQLLAQRFHLVVHHQSKLVSGFALVVAKGGPKLQTPAKPKRKMGGQILPNGLTFSNSPTLPPTIPTHRCPPSSPPSRISWASN
jgi:uncharacterized protein (TIGR03435 family)